MSWNNSKIYSKETIQNGKNNVESGSGSDMQRRQSFLETQMQQTQRVYRRWLQELQQAREPQLVQELQKKYEMKWFQLIQELQREIQIQRNQPEQVSLRKIEVHEKSELSQKNEVFRESEPQKKNEANQQPDPRQKVEISQKSMLQQKDEVQQKSETQQKRDEFYTAVMQHQSIDAQQVKQNQPAGGIREKTLVSGKVNEDRQQIQRELLECSKTIRDIQRAIKETYQFNPCRQLCEVLVNIRQKVYRKVEDIQEDLAYVIEAFGIDEFAPETGDFFEAKYHDQVISNVQDARGKEINRVYSSGFKMDGEVIVKAQVSVKERVHGGKL